MTFGFHPEARSEYSGAIDFYDAQRIGLGADFTQEIEAAVQRVLEAPDRWPRVTDKVRKCSVHIFPYLLLYSFAHEHVTFIAVMHGHRDPGYWRHRMG